MSSIPQRRVLVVDDEPLLCHALTMLLTFDGHAVDVANGSKEALDLFQKGKYDLVVTDYEMPWMRGDELALAIKAQDPAQRIMMISAYAQMLTAREGGIPGVDYVLGKPFLIEDVHLALRTVWAQHK
jgi:CheY-like chemotaxis protein